MVWAFPFPGQVPPVISASTPNVVHQALNIEEILRLIILWSCRPIRRKFNSKRKPNISSAALACRAFCCVVLDILWHETALLRLFRCMPETLLEWNEDHFTITRPIMRSDLDRLKIYSLRVHHLHISLSEGNEDSKPIGLHALQSLVYAFPPKDIFFPRLTRVNFSLSGVPEALTYLHGFLTPSVSEVIITARAAVLTTMSHLCLALRLICPSLRVLHITNNFSFGAEPPESDRAQAALRHLIRSLGELEDLVVPYLTLDVATLEHLAALPHLVSLVVGVDSSLRVHEGTSSGYKPKFGFPVLSSLRLWVGNSSESLTFSVAGGLPSLTLFEIVCVDPLVSGETLCGLGSSIIGTGKPEKLATFIVRQDGSIERQPGDDAFSLGHSLVAPLLQVPTLTDVDLQLPRLEVNESLMKEIAMSWPHLTRLRLASRPPASGTASIAQYAVPFTILEHLSYALPSLSSLDINLHIEPNGGWKPRAPSILTYNRQLRSLRVGETDLTPSSVIMVASCLSSWFPNLRAVYMIWYPVATENPSPEVEQAGLWEEVNKLLEVIGTAREEERLFGNKK